MALADPILLKEILTQRKGERAPESSESDFFELFVAEEILKNYFLSYDDLDSGLVGGSNDAGIDGFWLLADGVLICEDTDLASLRRNVRFELVIMQAKRSKGFGEEPINKLMAAAENLLNLANDLAQFESRYNAKLLSLATLFRRSYQELAGKFPSLRIRFVFATFGLEVHDNCRAKSEDLLAKIPALFSDATADFDFLGATQLVQLARRRPRQSFNLKLVESLTGASESIAYVCLVRIRDWFKFITDDGGSILPDMFEANVRAYQGKTEVNKEIQASLQENGPEDFWWLNNGVTVLASQATASGKSLAVEDPEIVNGLQTSQQIFHHFKSGEDGADERLILVRVIVPTEEGSRDRIIKATNSQTSIPPASLRATDKIQRDIEEYLRPRGIYYDRRKSFYRNAGKPIANIVGIAKMAQALMAIRLARPDTARARPSSLIKKENDYKKLFSENHPIEIYLACIRILRAVEVRIRQMDDLETKDKNNLRFYAALELARDVSGEMTPSLSTLKNLADLEFGEESVQLAIDRVLAKYRALGGSDKVAKGPDLKEALDREYQEPE